MALGKMGSLSLRKSRTLPARGKGQMGDAILGSNAAPEGTGQEPEKERCVFLDRAGVRSRSVKRSLTRLASWSTAQQM